MADQNQSGMNRGGLGVLEWSKDGGSTWNDLGLMNRNDLQPPNEESETTENSDGSEMSSWKRAPFAILAREPNETEVNDLITEENNNRRVHFRFKSVDDNAILYLPPLNRDGVFPMVEKGPIQEPGTYAYARIRGVASGPFHDYVQEVKIYS